jgi:hypothetical protein
MNKDEDNDLDRESEGQSEGGASLEEGAVGQDDLDGEPSEREV